jgi:hypothetical protein
MVLSVFSANGDRPLLLFFCIDWILGFKYDGVFLAGFSPPVHGFSEVEGAEPP